MGKMLLLRIKWKAQGSREGSKLVAILKNCSNKGMICLAFVIRGIYLLILLIEMWSVGSFSRGMGSIFLEKVMIKGK